MKALTWQGTRKVTVEEVPDPRLQHPTDAIVQITSTAICGSDLHLYEVFGPFLDRGDILGHEPMGIVVEVGAEVRNLSVGDRVVIPFNISCGECFMCRRGLQSQCETTQVKGVRQRCGAVRLHQAVRPGSRGSGGVPAGAPRRLQPHPRRQGTARRPVSLPQRHPADRLAGSGVRAGSRWRNRRGHGSGPGRPVRLTRRRPPRLSGARGGSGAGAPGDGTAPRSRDLRPDRHGRRRASGSHRGSRHRCRDRRGRTGGARQCRCEDSSRKQSGSCRTHWHGR